MRRESRCKMPRICSAPSEARAAGAAGMGAAAFAGTVPERRERLREIRISAESSPENKRLKKARNANTIRFNSMAPRFKDSKAGQARRPENCPMQDEHETGV